MLYPSEGVECRKGAVQNTQDSGSAISHILELLREKTRSRLVTMREMLFSIVLRTEYAILLRAICAAWYLTIRDSVSPTAPKHIITSINGVVGAVDAACLFRLASQVYMGQYSPSWVDVFDLNALLRIASIFFANEAFIATAITLATTLLLTVAYGKVASQAYAYRTLCRGLLSATKVAKDEKELKTIAADVLGDYKHHLLQAKRLSPLTICMVTIFSCYLMSASTLQTIIACSICWFVMSTAKRPEEIEKQQPLNPAEPTEEDTSSSNIPQPTATGTISFQLDTLLLHARVIFHSVTPLLAYWMMASATSQTQDLTAAQQKVLNDGGNVCESHFYMSPEDLAGVDGTMVVHAGGNPAALLVFRCLLFAASVATHMPLFIETTKWYAAVRTLRAQVIAATSKSENDELGEAEQWRQFIQHSIKLSATSTWEDARYAVKVALSSLSVTFDQVQMQVVLWRRLAFGGRQTSTHAHRNGHPVTPALDALLQARESDTSSDAATSHDTGNSMGGTPTGFSDTESLWTFADDPDAVLESPAVKQPQTSYLSPEAIREFDWSSVVAPVVRVFEWTNIITPLMKTADITPLTSPSMMSPTRHGPVQPSVALISSQPFASLQKIVWNWSLAVSILAAFGACLPLHFSIIVSSISTPCNCLAMLHVLLTCVACLHAIHVHACEIAYRKKTPTTTPTPA